MQQFRQMARTVVVFFDDGTAQFLFPLLIARIAKREVDPP